MAKRVRGSHSTHRPGGQGPARTTTTKPSVKPATVAAPAPPGPGPVATTAAVGAGLAAGAAVTAAASPGAASSTTAISKSTRGRVKVKANSLLASRADTEYRYVGQDLRRIAVVAAGLFGLLVLFWVLLVPLDLLGIY